MVRQDKADISVVIPTAGRRPTELLRAIESVRAQDIRNVVEIVVVDDSKAGLDSHELQQAAEPLRLRVVPTSGRVGQRSDGVRESSGEWVAFLDDDDFWFSGKLREQLELAQAIEARGALAVVSCRIQHSFDGSDRIVDGVPARLMSWGQSVSEYLFWRRDPSVRRASLYTSTLFASKALCDQVEWRRLPRHQDWDWLLRAASVPGVQVLHHPQVLANIHVGSANSISAGDNWDASLAWATNDGARYMSREDYADFLTAQVLRYALNARSFSGVRQTSREVLKNRRLPSIRAFCVGSAGLIPRRRLEQLMSLRRGSAAKKERLL